MYQLTPRPRRDSVLDHPLTSMSFVAMGARDALVAAQQLLLRSIDKAAPIRRSSGATILLAQIRHHKMHCRRSFLAMSTSEHPAPSIA
jgi:hypothetical protein